MSLRASRRYPGDWENEMNSKFITVVALVAAFAMPAVAHPVQATMHSTHGATVQSSHGALAHSTHGATVSHGGSAVISHGGSNVKTH
jgi:hypothetical protein